MRLSHRTGSTDSPRIETQSWLCSWAEAAPRECCLPHPSLWGRAAVPHTVLPRPGALAGPWSPGGDPLELAGRWILGCPLPWEVMLPMRMEICREGGRSLGNVNKEVILVLRSEHRGGCAAPAPVTPALRKAACCQNCKYPLDLLMTYPLQTHFPFCNNQWGFST